MDKRDRSLATFLVFYLLIFGIGGACAVLITFPTTSDNGVLQFSARFSPDQGLILLAFSAGMMGSFLHAAQSLISYIGNATFKASWAAWYALRPWIGAVLGVAIYFAFRAGLVAGASAVNPYGVVALGLLGGWFSKTTTDKLQEVFETLFKTDEDKDRKDKLRAIERPTIDSITPSPVPATTSDIFVVGHNFMEGAKVIVDGNEVDAEFIAETVLKTAVVQRPAAGARVTIKVKNPRGLEALSNDVTTIFE